MNELRKQVLLECCLPFTDTTKLIKITNLTTKLIKDKLRYKF